MWTCIWKIGHLTLEKIATYFRKYTPGETCIPSSIIIGPWQILRAFRPDQWTIETILLASYGTNDMLETQPLHYTIK